MTESFILGSSESVEFTDLSKFYPDRVESLSELCAKFAKTTKHTSSLILEPIGTLFKLLNPSTDCIQFTDPLVRQISFELENQ